MDFILVVIKNKEREIFKPFSLKKVIMKSHDTMVKFRLKEIVIREVELQFKLFRY